jgi:hypothetical protein
MNEWNIQSRSRGCQACGKGFADKQAYHTLLFDEKQQFNRLDVCHPCWEAQFSQGARDRKGFVSYWQGVYEAPPAAPPDPIKKENAESLLRRIIALNDPRFAAASFILAVMLERKRLFKIKEQYVRDGRRIFIYEQPSTGDLFTILDPDLQLKQLDQVQHDVALLLEQGLPPDGTLPALPAVISPETPVAPAEPATPESSPIVPPSAESTPAAAAGNPPAAS